MRVPPPTIGPRCIAPKIGPKTGLRIGSTTGSTPSPTPSPTPTGPPPLIEPLRPTGPRPTRPPFAASGTAAPTASSTTLAGPDRYALLNNGRGRSRMTYNSESSTGVDD